MHITPRIGLTLAALAALGVTAAHPAAAAPVAASSLSEQSRTVDSSVTVDLTAEGTIDWTKYSQATDGSPITYRKAGAPIITLTGVAGPQSYSDVGNNAPSFTWTDGAAPHQTGNDGSEYYYGTNGGIATGSYTLISNSLPGTTSVFNLYTGAYNGGATILADLYDTNGVVIQSFSDTFTAAAGQNLYKEYSFDYTGGAYLSTTVTSTNPYGNGFHTVNLQAASLSTPEPSSVAAFALTGLGVLGTALKARRRRPTA